MKKIAWLVGAGLGIAVLGCSKNEVSPRPALRPYKIVKSNLPRAKSSLASAKNVEDTVLGQTQLALDLISEIKRDRPSGSVLLSPQSLSLVLSAIYAGTEGRTETAMANAVHFSRPQSDFHSAMNAITQSISDRTKDTSGFRLLSNNAVWTDTHFTPLSSYLDTLAVNYGTGVYQMDFRSNPNASRQAVNDWIFSETNGLIPSLFDSGSINSQTAIVLANAIYLHADWRIPFDPDSNYSAPFNGESAVLNMPTMAITEEFPYFEDSELQAIELPYRNADFGLMILLPKDPAPTPSFATEASRFTNIAKSLRPRYVHMEIPKIRIDGGSDRLLDYLKGYGMPTKPYTAMFGPERVGEVELTRLIQKTSFTIDERGTTAAVATGGTGTTGAPAPPPPAETQMLVNHPFYFAIRDHVTGVTLFIGQFSQPGRQECSGTGP